MIKSYFKIGLTMAISLSIFGCSSAKIKNYSQEKPILKLEDYFNAPIDAYGIFQDRSGMVKKRFHCTITPKWENGVGTLDEQFTYSDGTTSRRVWTLKRQSDGKYVGTAADVVGEAIGELAGNALHWKYTLKLEVDGSTYNVFFDDWMYLMSDKVMLNKSVMSKFGVELGEVTLTFVKR